MRAGRFAGTAILAGLTLLGTGGATGFLLRPATAPEQLRAASDVTSAPVGHEQLTDERTVKISLVRSAPPPIVVGVAGRVTATSCRPGSPITSKATLARIGDTPLIALATDVPLHRDLAKGDKGADVKALQKALGVTVTGTYDRATANAVRKQLKRTDGTVAVGQIVWLPAESVTPTSCELIEGAYISSGQAYAKAPARLTAITTDSLPANLVPGDRELRVMGVRGPIGADGAATDEKFLGKVTESREYRMLEASGKDAELTATIALTEPLETAKVPPGALFGVQKDKGCVESGATAYPVTIVGSRLGATLVTGKVPEAVDLGPAIEAQRCG